jgi:hypothetical protein
MHSSASLIVPRLGDVHVVDGRRGARCRSNAVTLAGRCCILFGADGVLGEAVWIPNVLHHRRHIRVM